MYKYKIHKKSEWWNPDTMEDEEQAYCRQKNYKLLTASWKDVNCGICLIHKRHHILLREYGLNALYFKERKGLETE